MIYDTLISTGDLARQLDDPRLVIVDCRHNLADVDAGERAYLEAHIPGACFMHMDRDLSGVKNGRNGRHPLPKAQVIASKLGAAGIDASKQVIAYDQNAGMWASRLWWLLRWLGHDAVAVLDGGFDKWLAERRPTSKLEPDPRATRFVPKPAQRVASADEILRHLDDEALLVLDARAPERYRGDVEPMDPIAGHIPGARNRPYTENLAATGVFKPAALLRSEFEALLEGRSPSTVVHQCGSGVTSCHNVLAMAVGGLAGSRLYPGSWSEWVADPARPVARSRATGSS
ncbi:MAG TPA: sulfurtransferase [Casimicrobiaceae bacterium]|jgi:thiosulfate/3-mercaptopyruvate sulfurtransferase|nr:sulfurtransferase [Casimicrobiaceae bacterium]